MDNSHLMHELRIMASDIIGLEQGLKRLDWLEFEILHIKAHFNHRIKSIHNSICALIGRISVYSGFEDLFKDFAYTSSTSTSYIGNGYQEIVSTTPTVHKKTVEEIIREVQEMIIELQIKGSVREHRNGLLKFTSTVFGCVYGRTKEEIEKQLKEKIKQFKKKPQQDKQNEKKKSPLLSEYYKADYVTFKRRQNLKERYLKEIDGMFSFIMSQGFDKPLTTYKPKHIEDFLYSVPETRKRQKLQGLFNNMFTRALALSLIKTNPCAPLDKVQHNGEQGKAFSFEEQEDFFKFLFQDETLDYTRKCYFAFLYLTGTRRDEALGIKVEDANFKNKVLSIRGTKTEGSNRKIPLTPIVEKLLLSLTPKNGFYFPITSNSVNHDFRKVWVKEKGHKPHDLRHTFGTIHICVEKVDIKTVSLWMGHSDISTTVNIYTHPENLDTGTFLRGDLSSDEKTAVYRKKYGGILLLIKDFLR